MWDIFSIERCQIQLMGNNSSFFKVRFKRGFFIYSLNKELLKVIKHLTKSPSCPQNTVSPVFHNCHFSLKSPFCISAYGRIFTE